jgi:phage/plasmid-associated DNA primase
MDVDAFNNITTGDTVQGRKLYRDPVYYRPYATILIFSNHYPSFNDDSIGPMRRIIALRMNREFVHADGSRAEDYSETIDREIAEPIMRDALFRMAVEAVWNAATRGWEWTRPASSLRESALIRSATSTLRQFWEEFLVPDPAGCLPATVPFTCYAASCRDKLIDKKDFLTYGKFRNEAGMQLKVGIEQDMYIPPLGVKENFEKT